MNSYEKYLMESTDSTGNVEFNDVNPNPKHAINKSVDQANQYLPADRKQMPMFEGLIKYFPNALKYVSHVSYKANEQHHPNTPVHWDKNKSTDEKDCLIRHLTDHVVDPLDDDGLLHLGKVAWRSLANLERFLTDQKS